MPQNGSDEHDSLLEKVRQTVVGAPRNIKDPSIFHKLSLVPLLAWIGLGADGLSSSSYGPEEAFRALGQHTYLAVFPHSGRQGRRSLGQRPAGRLHADHHRLHRRLR
jgi:hypothetical protein